MHALDPDPARTAIDGGVGASRRHDSGHKHLTGAAIYTDDIPEPPGTLHIYIAMSERAQHKHQGGGVVVYYKRILAACDAPQQIARVGIARASLPGVEVVFKIAVCGHLGNGLDGAFAQGCAAQVCVDNDPCGVYYPPQARTRELRCRRCRACGDFPDSGCFPFASQDLFAELLDLGADGVHDQRMWQPGQGFTERWVGKHFIHRWDSPQPLRIGTVRGVGAGAWLACFHAAILPCVARRIKREADNVRLPLLIPYSGYV